MATATFLSLTWLHVEIGVWFLRCTPHPPAPAVSRLLIGQKGRTRSLTSNTSRIRVLFLLVLLGSELQATSTTLASAWLTGSEPVASLHWTRMWKQPRLGVMDLSCPGRVLVDLQRPPAPIKQIIKCPANLLPAGFCLCSSTSQHAVWPHLEENH